MYLLIIILVSSYNIVVLLRLNVFLRHYIVLPGAKHYEFESETVRLVEVYGFLEAITNCA